MSGPLGHSASERRAGLAVAAIRTFVLSAIAVLLILVLLPAIVAAG